MTKVKILTDGCFAGQKFKDAIGKVFDAEIKGELAHVDIGYGGVACWTYIIGTECEIVDESDSNETYEFRVDLKPEPNYAAQASEYGICITTADGVVYDGRGV